MSPAADASVAGDDALAAHTLSALRALLGAGGEAVRGAAQSSNVLPLLRKLAAGTAGSQLLLYNNI